MVFTFPCYNHKGNTPQFFQIPGSLGQHVLVHSTKGAYWKCSGLDTSVSSPEYSFELETHKKFTSQECTWLTFRYAKEIPLVLMNPWNLPGSCVDSKWFARTYSIQWSQNIKSAQASLVEVWHPFLTLRNHHLHSGLEHQKLCELLIPFLPVHFYFEHWCRHSSKQHSVMEFTPYAHHGHPHRHNCIVSCITICSKK